MRVCPLHPSLLGEVRGFPPSPSSAAGAGLLSRARAEDGPDTDPGTSPLPGLDPDLAEDNALHALGSLSVLFST